jgi:hypothetical protein
MDLRARLPHLRAAALGLALWPLRYAAWVADEVLDRVPAREDGRWHRYGGWGCRMGLSRLWDRALPAEREGKGKP